MVSPKFAKNVIYATIELMIKDQGKENKKIIFITNSARKTQKLGEILARELRGKTIICLSGELGSGKTTFAQGILKGLGAKGPYTSPTFVVMKHYKRKTQNAKRKATTQNSKIFNVYHIDVYRVRPKDILNLGWEEIIADKNNIVIIEWAERIRRIIPKDAAWVKFEHMEKEKRRKIVVNSNVKSQSHILNVKYFPIFTFYMWI